MRPKKGDIINKLTVLEPPYFTHTMTKYGWEQKRWFVKCKCECGKKIVVEVRGFKKETPQLPISCGCERIKNVIKAITKHGHAKNSTHGTPTYSSWTHMKNRCLNPKNKYYKHYGGRGITICEEWSDFRNFLRDMGESSKGDSLDRIDLDKGYYKENCRWADKITQANNTQRSHFLIYNGKKQTVAEWARELNLKYDTLSNRLKRGWTTKRALTTPV